MITLRPSNFAIEYWTSSRGSSVYGTSHFETSTESIRLDVDNKFISIDLSLNDQSLTADRTLSSQLQFAWRTFD